MAKMTVQEFVDKYNETPERQREGFLKSMVVTDYVPFELKVALMYDLVHKTHMEDGHISIKSPLCYALFMNLIVEQYLDVQIDKNDQIKDFNLMNKSRIFDILMIADDEHFIINANELEEFKMIVDMVKSDFMTNNFSTQAFVNEQVKRISDVLHVSLEPIVQQLNEQIKDINIIDVLKIKNK